MTDIVYLTKTKNMTPETKQYLIGLIQERQEVISWKLSKVYLWEESELKTQKLNEVEREINVLDKVIKEVDQL